MLGMTGNMYVVIARGHFSVAFLLFALVFIYFEFLALLYCNIVFMIAGTFVVADLAFLFICCVFLVPKYDE